MRILRIALIVLAVLIGIFLLMGLVLPRDYQLERSTVIDASPQVVFPYVQMFKERAKWYTWNKMDPDMESEIEGPDGEVGTVYEWEGDPKTVGSGSQEIVEVVLNETVRNKIQFEEPMEAEALDYVNLEAVEGGTRVTWGFESRFPFPWNALLPFMGMEKSVGKDYEEGLANLKELVESRPKVANLSGSYEGFDVQVVEMPERHYVLLQDRISFDEMESFFANSYAKLMPALEDAGVSMAGGPSGLYFDWNEAEKTTDMAAAVPINEQGHFPDLFTQRTLPAGKMVLVNYYGSYDKLGDVHNAIDAFAQAHQLELGAPAIEEYITGPEQEPDPSKWLTRIMYPLRG